MPSTAAVQDPEKGVLLFDVETDGLLQDLTRIHALVVKHLPSGDRWMFSEGPKADGHVREGVLKLLEHTQQGGLIEGHNAIKFDVPAIRKVFPWFSPDMSLVRDTLVLSRLIYPDLTEVDLGLMKQNKDDRIRFPKYLFKRHSLEAWGHRLGVFKGDYAGDPLLVASLMACGKSEEEAKKEAFKRRWEGWNQEMEDYCVQDVEVTEKLHNRLYARVEGTPQFLSAVELERAKKKPRPYYLEGFSQESVELEHQVAVIVARQERFGIRFDNEKAAKLYSVLVQKKLELEAELKRVFKPRYFRVGQPKAPAVSRRDQEELLGINYSRPLHTGKGKAKVLTGYCWKSFDFTAGAPYQQIKLVEFNPGSRDHIAKWLKELYGWEPLEYTAEGKPKVDETVLGDLKYPEAVLLRKYLTVDKRIGQLSEGSEAWMRNEKGGRIYGQVVTNGAVTGRMTHSKPNLGQVPAGYSPYGPECRELFGGPFQVGADAAALELRDLAGYMARYDGGAYAKTVVDGKKENGDGIHSVNAKALGLDPKKMYFDGETGRDLAKTWFYAFIYGAGDEKLGFILTKKKGEQSKAIGLKSRKTFMASLPALGKLVERVRDTVKKRGFLRGLDGRLLSIRHQHSALNTLLQGAGAAQMKRALVILDKSLQEMGFKNTGHYLDMIDYEFIANVHDEWQIETREELGEAIGKAAVAAIRKAGESFGFRCPLDGEYKLGHNWAETH